MSQYLVPGEGVLHDAGNSREFLVPGTGTVNEKSEQVLWPDDMYSTTSMDDGRWGGGTYQAFLVF